MPVQGFALRRKVIAVQPLRTDMTTSGVKASATTSLRDRSRTSTAFIQRVLSGWVDRSNEYPTALVARSACAIWRATFDTIAHTAIRNRDFSSAACHRPCYGQFRCQQSALQHPDHHRLPHATQNQHHLIPGAARRCQYPLGRREAELVRHDSRAHGLSAAY